MEEVNIPWPWVAGATTAAVLVLWKLIDLWAKYKTTRTQLRDQQNVTEDQMYGRLRQRYLDDLNRLDKVNREQADQIQGLNEQIARLTRAQTMTVRVTATVRVGWKDGVITYACPRIYEVLKWKPEDLVGQPAEVMVPPEKRARHRAAWLRAQQTRTLRAPDRPIRDFVLCGDGSLERAFIAIGEYPDDDPVHGPQLIVQFYLFRSFTSFDVVSGSGDHRPIETDRRIDPHPTPPPGTPERRETA